MSIHRASRRRISALIPLGVLSTAWTASLAGIGSGAVMVERSLLPDGTQVPAQVVEQPASYTHPGSVGLSASTGDRVRIVATAATNGIPSASYNAYMRAEQVMNAADKACRVDWQLVAAIGRVESDHGRYGGNTVGTDGISRPGIYGVPLDGSNGTTKMTDTDAGQWDDDELFDRAVGPMQFIPSTWSEVAVDADGDAKRNPQDVDDAALAAAVYLCSGADDLTTDAGRRAAVHRYNHSRAYVDLVLAVREAYLEGDYARVPNYVTSAVTVSYDDGFLSGARPGRGKPGAKGAQPPGDSPGTASTPTTWQPSPTPSEEPSEPAPTRDMVSRVGATVKKTVQDTGETLDRTVTKVLTLPQAILLCSGAGYNALLTPTLWNTCITEHTAW